MLLFIYFVFIACDSPTGSWLTCDAVEAGTDTNRLVGWGFVAIVAPDAPANDNEIGWE